MITFWPPRFLPARFYSRTYWTDIAVPGSGTYWADGFFPLRYFSHAYFGAAALGLTASCPTTQPAIGVPYSYAITVSGGVPPYTFTIIAGSLTPGLTLNSSTGVISGTPTEPGTFPWQLFVQDSSA